MPENSQNDCTQQLPDSGHQKIRYFNDDPSTGWQAIPAARAEAIYRRELRVPELAGKTMRIAIAYVKFDAGTPITLSSLSISHWKIDDDGIADKTDQMRRIIEKIDGGVGGDGDSIATNDDVEAIKCCLGLSGAS